MARKSGVRQDIFDIWQANPDWSPKEIRTAVIDKLGKRKSRDGTYPGIRLVQKFVHEFIENLGQLVDEDKPWSIAASVKHGLPPEATKDLFDIWRFSLALDRPISIRQAKWLVHLRNLFYQPLSTGNVYSDKVNRNLWLIRQSWLYSVLERASRILGEKYFDTSNLDAESFMSPWEHLTALELGKVSPINYSQEALDKLEKHGASLTSPPVSINSVEEAVWHEVRDNPPPHLELMADYTAHDDILPEEDDLVAAYWLTHLSKGPLWNKLPEQPDIKARLEYRAREGQREKEAWEQAKAEGRPYMWVDSGVWSYEPLYARQLSVRKRVLKWVKAKRDYYPAVIRSQKGIAFVFNAMLLKTVGYEVTPEDMELWFELRKQQLKAQHKGYDKLPPDIQEKFIHDEQTPDDEEALEKADNQVALEQKQREEEFLGLVRQKGGPPKPGAGYEKRQNFWKGVRDEWISKNPDLAERAKKQKNFGEHHQPKDYELEYERLKANLSKKAQK